MKRASATALILAAMSLAVATPASAVLITFNPVAADAALGDGFTVDVVVSGLREGGANELVSAFDLDVLYDPLIASVSSVAFSDALGLPDIEAFTSSFFSAGRIDLASISLLGNAELFALQGDAVVLAQLAFDAIGIGSFFLSFDPIVPPGALLVGSDPFSALDVTELGVAQVNVSSSVSAPEPGAFALALLGLSGALLARRRAPAQRVRA